jgi:gas vesicle protein
MDTKKFAIGLGVGLIVGGVIALLTAPKSGKETRALIKDKIVSAKVKAAQLKEKAARKAAQVKQALKEE